jgi:2-polyprenyl-6-methoxyphenol hydroxylase-like FAD-dependent oxidoreductase
MHEYDLVVIGSGPTGQRAAITAATLGKHVAVVERHVEVGGGSIVRGTIPSKTKHERAGRAASCRRCRSIPSSNGFVSPGFGMVESQSPHLIRSKGEVLVAIARVLTQGAAVETPPDFSLASLNRLPDADEKDATLWGFLRS